MKIAVVGTGYVGLVAGSCLAETGNNVTCVDIDEKKIRRLKDGDVPIYEPGLEELLKRNLHDGRLHFTTRYEDAIPNAEVAFIAVGTPSGEDGSADLKYVLEAARSIARHMTGYLVVVDKSTVPVGTAKKVEQAMREVTRHPFDVASNPEFLKEGAAIDDFLKPDRVVIGSESTRAKEAMDLLYAPFVRTGNPIIHMDRVSAELTKYAANAMLATRISFMNEIANLCERLGVDVEQVRRGIGMDPRIGAKFLFPGLGYGGSCFPKDVKAILSTGRDAGSPLEVIEAVDRANDRQKAILADKITAHFARQGVGLRGRTVCLWGLSFKPGTDDIREAPAISVIDRLLAEGVSIRATDPAAMGEMRHRYGDKIALFESGYEAAQGADALALITEWHEFRRPNFDRLKEILAQPVLFDGRNVWEPEDMRARGFTYYGIGRH